MSPRTCLQIQISSKPIMACRACLQDPLTHSFEPMTRRVLHGRPTPVFYTSYKHVKDYSNPDAIIQHITGELEQIDVSGGWGWIMDCKHLASKHVLQMQVSLRILKFLQGSYSGTLRFLYIVNGGTLMTTALTAFYPFLTSEFRSRIHKLNGSALELFEQLKGVGWTKGELEPFVRRIMREY